MGVVNILLVDDHQADLLALESILQPLQQTLIRASSGEEALELVRRQDFAVILLDVNLPGMSGIETATLIRELPRAKNTPIIFVTAFEMDNLHLAEAYTAGGVDYILKPISANILQAKVGTFVELYLQNQMLRRQLEEIQQLQLDVVKQQRVTKQHQQLLRHEQSAHAQAQVAREQMALLADASKTLSSSLDYQATLTNLVELLVPTLADGCTVDLLDAQGNIQPLARRDVEPEKRQLFDALYQQFAVHKNAPGGLHRVLQTGEPEFYPQVDDDLLVTNTSNREQLRLIRSINLCSIVIVPIKVRERILGAMTCVTMRSRRQYTTADFDLIGEIASRAAIAIENAELYHKAQEAIRKRDEFLSAAAHELRTPITALRGFAQRSLRQLDKQQPIDGENIRRVLTIVNQQAERLGKLVTQLLDISRIQAERLSLERSTVDVVGLVKDIVRMFQDNATQHAIRISAPPSLLAEIDPLRMEQVVINLVDNAIKYSPNGGEIIIEVSKSADLMRIAVTDQGLGIPPEHRPYIFERFYQAHSDGNLGGIGLGLHISREIVRLHGGDISVEFPAKGGTAFIISLPI